MKIIYDQDDTLGDIAEIALNEKEIEKLTDGHAITGYLETSREIVTLFIRPQTNREKNAS